MMRIDILTLFPEMLSPLTQSVIGRAVEKGVASITIHDYRDFAVHNTHHVDDYSYGGGAGMIAEVAPIIHCLRSIEGHESARKIITLPSGMPYTQSHARELASLDHLVIVCGHYEGVDARVEHYMDEAISLGDYILSGGEYAALAIADSVIRLLPGALGNDESTADESFTEPLLEHDQFTRPETFEGLTVPAVLIAGDHEKVRIWRRKNALAKTRLSRPDLFARLALSEEDKRLLREIEEEEHEED